MSRYIIIFGLITFFILYITIELQPTPRSALPTVISVPFEKKITVTKAAFNESSLKWKIINKHQQTSKQLTSLTETIGSGICTLDINKDGWMDLFFVGGSGHTRYYGKQSWWLKSSGNRLLLNIKGSYFSDITESSGLTNTKWGMGCSVADFNNDGLSDLFITTVGENQLYANQADNTFIDVTHKSGLSGNNWSMAATLGDFNKDGLLDIYLSNFIDYKRGARTFERTQGFRLTTDTAFDATLYVPQSNKLYVNKGNFIFEDVTTKMDVANPLGRSVGAKWYDLNQDSWLDLIIINAQKSANQVLINHEGQKFSRGESLYAPLEVSSSHDLLINDFNNNQQDEYLISRSIGYPPVFLNRIDSDEGENKHTFKDGSWNNGLAQAKLLANNSWATLSADFNNDSFLDLFIANGMSTPDIDVPFVSQGQQNTIFLNNKTGGFQLQSSAFEKHFPNSSRGAITVDLNNDGTMEIVVSNNNGDLQVFENKIKNDNNWLGINLFSNNKNEDIYGTKIELINKELTLQKKIQPKQSFLSQSDHRIHFGLAENDIIDKLKIYWPDGKISSFDNIKVNQYISINKEKSRIIKNNPTLDKNPLEKPAYLNLNEQSLQALTTFLMQYPPDEVDNKIIDIWHDSSPKTQELILLNLKEKWHSNFISIVKEALTSHHTQLRLLAIQLLKKLEIESSINWLIPFLNDSKPRVQCEIAKTFEFFFNEEEAVTHRKFLALSPLIKKLESANDEVKVCVINALSRAEKKRAILPLQQLINTSQNARVQAASIRALGLIRDKRSIKLLIKIAHNTENNPEVLASALIALKRLNYQDINQLINLVIGSEIRPEKRTAVMTRKSYQVLSYLFSHPDGTSFSRKQLQTLFDNLIKQNKTTEEQSILVAKLNTIAAGKLQQHYLLNPPLLTHPNYKVRLHAFKALASLNNVKAKELFENSLLKLPFPELIVTINKLNKQELTLSNHFIKRMLAYAHQEKYPVEQLSKLLPVFSQESAIKLFNQLINSKLTNVAMLQVFNDCSLAKMPHLIKFDIDIPSLSNKALLAYGACIFSEKESSLITSNKQISLKKHQLLLTILMNESFSENEKNTLLIKAAQGDAIIAEASLLKRIKRLPKKYYPEAISALKSHQLTTSLQDFLWRIVESDEQSNDVRLLAAKHLVPFAPSKVFAYINKVF
jgi:hypothetical protein